MCLRLSNTRRGTVCTAPNNANGRHPQEQPYIMPSRANNANGTSTAPNNANVCNGLTAVDPIPPPPPPPPSSVYVDWSWSNTSDYAIAGIQISAFDPDTDTPVVSNYPGNFKGPGHVVVFTTIGCVEATIKINGAPVAWGSACYLNNGGPPTMVCFYDFP